MAACTFLFTLSFLFTTPRRARPHSPFGGFLMKDLILLGAALYTTGEALDASRLPHSRPDVMTTATRRESAGHLVEKSIEPREDQRDARVATHRRVGDARTSRVGLASRGSTGRWSGSWTATNDGNRAIPCPAAHAATWLAVVLARIA